MTPAYSRFVELVENVEGGSTEAAEKAFKAFLRETTNVEYQAQKYAAICTAQQKEQESYVRKQQLLQQHIEQVSEGTVGIDSRATQGAAGPRGQCQD